MELARRLIECYLLNKIQNCITKIQNFLSIKSMLCNICCGGIFANIDCILYIFWPIMTICPEIYLNSLNTQILAWNNNHSIAGNSNVTLYFSSIGVSLLTFPMYRWIFHSLLVLDWKYFWWMLCQIVLQSTYPI